MNIFQKIRSKQKESRISGVIPTHLLLTPQEFEDLWDEFLQQEDVDKRADFDGTKILGMDIICGEEKILKLK